MLFIILLVAATMAIAGAAAFFSVYGLAHTFSGTFWSVVVMGGSLEAGKLIAASYLYRYWTRTHWILKTYLISGIVALMIMTSTGIFGYLSSGYQADVLPLKQLNEQIRLLEDERIRTIDRKKQIDDQLSKGPVVGNVASGSKIDPNAAKTIREARRSQESLNKQYKAEQEQTTKRVAELDQQLLELKQQLVKTEAHIGPITYIASAFGAEADDATKYLILLIIFAFDPMAVALTIAVNNAIRLRQEDQQETKNEQTVAQPISQPPEEIPEEPPEVIEDPVVPIIEPSIPQEAEPVPPVINEPEIVRTAVRPAVVYNGVVEKEPEQKPVQTSLQMPEERGMYLWVRDVVPSMPEETVPKESVEPEQIVPEEILEEIVPEQPVLGDIRTDKTIDANLGHKISQLRENLAELDNKPVLTEEDQRLRLQIINLIDKTETVLKNRHTS
jgi:hypothetical protein